ncbi:MFS transporter [Rhodoferax koreense]|uniref:MFS transporter n=2 Tax=Rhodoferax koreensis TaxID=1842727 RepID=A0A1P8K4E1_9BURK|nr:MFS transporter [Rhodoferax koreense]
MTGVARSPGLARSRWSTRVQWLLGTACGLLIANVYYAQPLTALITSALGMPKESAGLLVTLPLAGYGLGLLMVVPLADLVENKRLAMSLVGLEALCLTALSMLDHPGPYLFGAFFVGVSATAVQVLVPYVTFLAPEKERGRAVGKVVSGVMLGIMLARPVSSAVAQWFSWRAVFAASAVLMAALLMALRSILPERVPEPGLTYGAMLRSMGEIFTSTPVLRRRAFYHAFLFGTFSVFWTAVPLWLSGPQFHLTQSDIAWVALAGVAGAVAPPLAGRLADQGFSRLGTGLALLLAALAFSSTALIHGGSLRSVGLLVVAAIALDFAVSANLVFGQRAIYALKAEIRGRLNGLFMATFFAGGAIGSALGGWTYYGFGWRGVALLGTALPAMGFAYFLTEEKPDSVLISTQP